MTPAIETRSLTRRFGRLDAVNDLTLAVPAGSIFALIGPNGAGKTTTIKLLMNLLRPSGGAASVLGTESRRLGVDPDGVDDFRRIGYVSENQQLPEWMTPAELLDYCRPLYPTWDRALEKKLQADLALTSRTPLRKLSRGTRMKAALLASLAYRPELVVLDEPFTGLDPLVRDELANDRDRPWTVFISSHDVDEVERLADWVGFMCDGRLVFAEPVASLLTRFRLVEVVSREGEAAAFPQVSDWILQGRAGRTLRFVDTRHDRADAHDRIAATFSDTEIRTSPMALREIFVALARALPRGEAV